MARALGKARRAQAEVVKSRTRLENVTQTFLLLLIAVMFCLQSPMHPGSVESYTDLCTHL